MAPSDGVARLEGLERAHQGRTAARIVGTQFTGIKACVSDVTAAATGNPDFGEEMWGFLQQSDARLRRGFSASDGGKKTSRATAHDDDALAHGRRLETKRPRLKR